MGARILLPQPRRDGEIGVHVVSAGASDANLGVGHVPEFR
jgi:hypothetical protein